MRKFFAIMMRYFFGIILIALSALALIVMLCYYQEPVAVWPAAACAICFILSVVCFTED